MQRERDLPKVKEQVSGRPEIRLVVSRFFLLFTTKEPASLLLGTVQPDGICSTRCHSVLGVALTTSFTLKQPFSPPLKGIHFGIPPPGGSDGYLKGVQKRTVKGSGQATQLEPLQLGCQDIFLSQRTHKQITLFPFGLWG